MLIVGVLSIASSAPIIRAITERAALRGAAGSVAIAAARMTIASLLLAPGWLAARRRQERAPPWGAVLLAGVALALHFAAWISSLSFTTMASSTVIVTTNPVWVAIVTSIARRALPSRRAITGLLLALVGALWIAWGDASAAASIARRASRPLLGDALALVGAWAATAYYLASRRAQERGASLAVVAPSVYTVAAVALAPIALATGALRALIAPWVLPWVLALAVVPQLVGHTAFHWAMRYRSATTVTTVILLELVGAALIGAVAFGERPSTATLVGAAIVLVGVLRTASADEGTVRS